MLELGWFVGNQVHPVVWWLQGEDGGKMSVSSCRRHLRWLHPGNDRTGTTNGQLRQNKDACRVVGGSKEYVLGV